MSLGVLGCDDAPEAVGAAIAGRSATELEESLAAAEGRSASPSGACGTGGFTPKAKPSPASRSSAPLSAPDPPGGSRRDGHWTAYVSLT